MKIYDKRTTSVSEPKIVIQRLYSTRHDISLLKGKNNMSLVVPNASSRTLVYLFWNDVIKEELIAKCTILTNTKVVKLRCVMVFTEL